MDWKKITALVLFFILISWLILYFFFQTLAVWIFWSVLVFLVFFGIWALLSLKIVGPDEMAVKIIWGKPREVCDSGFCFVYFLPGLECYLVRFPKKKFNFDYSAKKVISKQDEYPVGSGLDCGSQILKVDAAAYVSFPRKGKSIFPSNNEALIEILRSQIPIDEEALRNWTEEAVIGAVRAVLGRMTWREAKQEQGKVEREVNAVFKEEDGALIKVGFQAEDVGIVIKEIEIPSELESILVKFDKERLEAEAAPFEAEQIAKETAGAYIQALSQGTEKTPNEICRDIEQDPQKKEEYEKFCRDLIRRRMHLDKGAIFDIRTPEAKGVEGTILRAIATVLKMSQGNSVDDTINDKTKHEGTQKERKRVEGKKEAARRRREKNK